MRNQTLLFSLFLFIILSSCEKKEKYYGEWMMGPPYQATNQAEKIIITKDSIFIGAYPYHKLYSESLKLNGNKLELFQNNFKVKIENDSLLHFNNATYIKKGYPLYKFLYDPKKLISIEYPKIENVNISNRSDDAYIYFGKKLNSNEFGLQLNDRITAIKDLRNFLFPACGAHTSKLSLTADKNAKMKDINEIFHHSKSIDVRIVKLVNNINYYYENNNMILTSEEGIHIFLNRFKEEEIIHRNEIPKPPPPLLNYSLKKSLNDSRSTIISLINDELFYGLKKVNKEELYQLILNNFKDNYIIVLYDDESTYSKYLELMNIYNTAFIQIRNNNANKRFNKLFDSLSREEKIELQELKQIFTGISYNDLKKLNINIPELQLLE